MNAPEDYVDEDALEVQDDQDDVEPPMDPDQETDPGENVEEEEEENEEEEEEEDLELQLAKLENFHFEQDKPPEEDLTGKQAYKAVCDKLDEVGLMKFDSKIEQLTEKTTQLVIEHGGLGDRGAQALAATIRILSDLHEIALRDNSITDVGIEYILNELHVTKTVTRLDLSCNLLGTQPGAMDPSRSIGAQMRHLLSKNTSLLELVLNQNRISDKDMVGIAEGMMENTTIQTLDLSFNSIGSRGGMEIAKILHYNTELKELNLEWNKLRTVGTLAVLKDGLMLNNVIKRINLGWNGIDEEGGEVLGKIIGDNAIEDILVQHNRIGPKGAAAIAKGIKATSALVTLVIDANPIQDEGCAAILHALQENTTMRKVSLQDTKGGKLTETAYKQLELMQCRVNVILPKSLFEPSRW